MSSQYSPAIGADPAGNFVVLWADYIRDGGLCALGEGGGIFAQRFASNGGRLGTEFQVNTYTTCHQRSPDVAVDAAGGFVVVWDSAQPNTSDNLVSTAIFGQRYTNAGVPLGSEFQINAFTSGARVTARIAIDAEGNFLVAWADAREITKSHIFTRAYASNGDPLGGETQANTFTGFPPREGPDVASAADDCFVATWTGFGQDGPGVDGRIIARRYIEQGIPATGKFLVNTYTSGTQRDSNVAGASTSPSSSHPTASRA